MTSHINLLDTANAVYENSTPCNTPISTVSSTDDSRQENNTVSNSIKLATSEETMTSNINLLDAANAVCSDHNDTPISLAKLVSEPSEDIPCGLFANMKDAVPLSIEERENDDLFGKFQEAEEREALERELVLKKTEEEKRQRIFYQQTIKASGREFPTATYYQFGNSAPIIKHLADGSVEILEVPLVDDRGNPIVDNRIRPQQPGYSRYMSSLKSGAHYINYKNDLSSSTCPFRRFLYFRDLGYNPEIDTSPEEWVRYRHEFLATLPKKGSGENELTTSDLMYVGIPPQWIKDLMFRISTFKNHQASSSKSKGSKGLRIEVVASYDKVQYKDGSAIKINNVEPNARRIIKPSVQQVERVPSLVDDWIKGEAASIVPMLPPNKFLGAPWTLGAIKKRTRGWPEMWQRFNLVVHDYEEKNNFREREFIIGDSIDWNNAPGTLKDRSIPFNGQLIKTVPQLLAQTNSLGKKFDLLKKTMRAYLEDPVANVRLDYAELKRAEDSLHMTAHTEKSAYELVEYQCKRHHIRHEVVGDGMFNTMKSLATAIANPHIKVTLELPQMSKFFQSLLQPVKLMAFCVLIYDFYQEEKVSVRKIVCATLSTFADCFTSMFAAGAKYDLYSWFQKKNLVYQGEGDKLEELPAGFFSSITTMILSRIPNMQEGVLARLFTLIRQTEKSLAKVTADGIAKFIVDAVCSIFERITAAIQNRNLWILISGITPASWLIKADQIVKSCNVIVGVPGEPLETLRKHKLLPADITSYMSNQEMVEYMEVLMEQGQNILGWVRADSAKKQVTTLLTALTTLKADLVSRVQANEPRTEPYCVFLYGPPGTGKSNIVPILTNAIATQFGYDPRESAAYQPGYNFQTAITASTWMIKFDDVDHSTAPPASGTMTYVDYLCKCINNIPFENEEAESGRKGKTFLRPAVVVACSNFPNMRADTVSVQPAALARRFQNRYEVMVKKEYRVPGGFMLDITKVPARSSDIYSINKYVYTGSQEIDKFWRLEKVGMNISEFVKFVIDDMRQHQARQQARLSPVDMSKACPTCYIVDSMCSCSQGSFAPVANIKAESIEDLKALAQKGEIWKESIPTPKEEKKPEFKSKGKMIRQSDEPITESIHDLVDEEQEAARRLERELVRFAQTIPGSRIIVEDDMDDWEPSWWQALAVSASAGIIAAPNNLFSNTIQSMFNNMSVISKAIAACGGAAALIFAARMAYRAMFPKSEALPDGDVTRQNVPAFMETFGKDWTRTDLVAIPTLGSTPSQCQTISKHELVQLIRTSTVKCVTPSAEVNGVAIGAGCILVPTHVFYCRKFDDDEVKEQFMKGHSCPECDTLTWTYMGNRTRTIKRNDLNVRVLIPNDELCIVNDPEMIQIHGVHHHIFAGNSTGRQSYDQAMFVTLEDEIDLSKKNCRKILDMKGVPILASDHITKKGDCGGLYIACINDKQWKIIAMHYALFNASSKSVSMGALTVHAELQARAREMGVVYQGAATLYSTLLKNPVDLSLQPYTKLSSVWAAYSQRKTNILPLGHMAAHNATFKSMIKPSMMFNYPPHRQLCKEVLGDEEPFKMPTERGQMIDGIFVSPFTDGFRVDNDKQLDKRILAVATADYLKNLDKCVPVRLAKLSVEQAVRGIPGTTINGVNLNTSVGPPYSGIKRNHIAFDEELVAFSPDVCKVYLEVAKCVTEGIIPMIQGLETVKDDIVKKSKLTRTFTNHPSGATIFFREYMQPISQFLRENMSVFEMAVGLNMTSVDCGKLLDHLAKVDPKLKQLFDADTVKMDKATLQQLIEVVAKVSGKTAVYLGGDFDPVYTIVVSIGYVIHCYKGDLFVKPVNTSGNVYTVEINSITVSIIVRYVFYITYPYKGNITVIWEWYISTSPLVPESEKQYLVFQDHYAIITYGDDLGGAKASDGTEFLDLSRLLREHVGFRVTDGKKGDTVLLKPLEEIVFLKRSFRKIEGVEHYVARLDESSILRMLSYKKSKTLSDADHQCITLSQALREYVYYGREVYEARRAMYTEFLMSENITNGYFVSKPYEYWVEKIRDGTFSAWELDTVPTFLQLE